METRANQYPSLTYFPVDFEFDQGYDVMICHMGVATSNSGISQEGHLACQQMWERTQE